MARLQEKMMLREAVWLAQSHTAGIWQDQESRTTCVLLKWNSFHFTAVFFPVRKCKTQGRVNTHYWSHSYGLVHVILNGGHHAKPLLNMSGPQGHRLIDGIDGSLTWPLLMFLSWINCKMLHLVWAWVLTSEMCSICLGHPIYGNLTLATISSEIIQCNVSTVRRTEMTCICEYLHCQEMISVDWLACFYKSLLAALSVATALESAWDGLFANRPFAAWPGDIKDQKDFVSWLCRLELLISIAIEKGKVPWWLLTSGSILFLL